MMEGYDGYYLGRIFDDSSGETTDRPLLYDPDDLTTHALVVGMTGSGKTGLCLDLLEEAALKGVPALMIDPKGDITNALLHFPELAPADFQPWINPDQARREEKTVEQAAGTRPNCGATASRSGRSGRNGSGSYRKRPSLPSTRLVPMLACPSPFWPR